MREHQYICALNTQQTAACDGGCGGGVIHLVGHTAAIDCQVTLADVCCHANVGRQQIVRSITRCCVNAQSGQQHRLTYTHVFVTELSSGRAGERHAIAAQHSYQRRTRHHRVGVGVIDLVCSR